MHIRLLQSGKVVISVNLRCNKPGLRTENQSLRNVVQQTNQKLNALISLQMDAADRGGESLNEELRMLRSKTASLEAEIQVSISAIECRCSECRR